VGGVGVEAMTGGESGLAGASVPMSVTRKLANLAGTTLPLVGLGVAIVLLWDRTVGVRELTILFVGYVVAGLGITVGYHRLFTHRSFQTSRALRYVFAVCGQFAVEGNVVSWVANHRKHHQFSDRSGDPHSPHADRGEGLLETLKGLWHAHMGWLFDDAAVADRRRYAPDLIDDRGLRVIAALFVPMVFLSLLVPGIVGWAWIGGWYGFLAGVVWGGAIRILLLHHVTWSINSICHCWGRRRFSVSDESRNVWWLSWLSFGESWHHNHHAFPSSAFHGLRVLEIDPGGWLIRGLERCGLAWRVVRIPTERQAAKLLPAVDSFASSGQTRRQPRPAKSHSPR
jgi:stearoyl-CoA desaturase (delta-9 desaturase)